MVDGRDVEVADEIEDDFDLLNPLAGGIVRLIITKESPPCIAVRALLRWLSVQEIQLYLPIISSYQGFCAAVSCFLLGIGSTMPNAKNGKNTILSPLAFHISYDPQSGELRRG